MDEREQRFTFDEVADLYNQARPEYPEALFDDVVTLAGIRTAGNILEIGCGTGKATVGFARRGFHIVCLEPGPSLARVARAALSGFADVDVLPYTLEAWPIQHGVFDLVVSAQAFHWLSPQVRFEKSAAALRPGGSLAIFGNAEMREASPLRQKLDAVYARHAPSCREGVPGSWYADDESIRGLFDECRRFAPVTQRSYSWSRAFTAGTYVNLLQTYSNHRMLSPEQREALLAGLRQVIEDSGGTMTIRYEAHLHLARRLD